MTNVVRDINGVHRIGTQWVSDQFGLVHQPTRHESMFSTRVLKNFGFRWWEAAAMLDES